MPDSNQEDNIIKNPARDKKILENQDFYVPEHVRLGIHPILQDFSTIDGKPVQGEFFESDLRSVDNYTSYVDKIKEPIKSKAPDVGEFVLMVHGKVISHGDHDLILSETKSILYGEHPNFTNVNIKVDDVVILKRIGLKVGVFLDE